MYFLKKNELRARIVFSLPTIPVTGFLLFAPAFSQSNFRQTSNTVRRAQQRTSSGKNVISGNGSIVFSLATPRWRRKLEVFNVHARRFVNDHNIVNVVGHSTYWLLLDARRNYRSENLNDLISVDEPELLERQCCYARLDFPARESKRCLASFGRRFLSIPQCFSRDRLQVTRENRHGTPPEREYHY
ncbi:hypothetical protein [Paraburkholderia sp. BL6669N2]|uniref:hypothetical protein n=1 Tax=Paraburkholderia sp. BL6669N2 TaxID=1938807 RepID=UPI0011C05F30|nr:hypothetical protein [Paraburkholderia sp. BL6669N2]